LHPVIKVSDVNISKKSVGRHILWTDELFIAIPSAAKGFDECAVAEKLSRRLLPPSATNTVPDESALTP